MWADGQRRLFLIRPLDRRRAITSFKSRATNEHAAVNGAENHPAVLLSPGYVIEKRALQTNLALLWIGPTAH